MTNDTFDVFATAALKHAGTPGRGRSTPGVDNSRPLFSDGQLGDALATISAWPGYESTPLVSLAGLAQKLDIAQIHYKDEGNRFGLGSFKALGGAYAVGRAVAASHAVPSSITIASATDGNHGLSVAWGAKTHGCRCVIFIHAEVSAGRERSLRSQGADVIRIDGNYDQSVRRCYTEAKDNGWKVISDTSTEDAGDDVARTVMAGYSVMFAEIVAQLSTEPPTHVFIQGGVGGLAATACEYFQLTWGSSTPRFVIVEPELAPCLYESARSGKRVSVEVRQETVMAGLSCGEVSTVAWPTLSMLADDYLTIPDSVVAPTMTLLADAQFADPPIIAGESAVAGLSGLICARQNNELALNLGLNSDSRVLVIGTEGATDPDVYASLTGRTVASVQRASPDYS
jgi:diaminopropionate ammonia-lyase